MSVENEDASEKKQDVADHAADAAEKLAAHLDISFALTQLCEVLTGTPDGDRLAPVFAASRMMNSAAAVAKAMAAVSQRPKRSIVERIQKLDPEAAELNSLLREKKRMLAEHREQTENLRELTRRLEELSRLTPQEKAKVSVAQLFADFEHELSRLEPGQAAVPADG